MAYHSNPNNQEPKILNLEQQLYKCETLADVFEFLSNYFDLKNQKIPLAFKGLIVKGILSAIAILNPKRR
jgi:hypothetical protein